MNQYIHKKRLITLAGLALTTSITSGMAMAEIASDLTFTNDYRFRGISQTAGNFAIQGSVNWSNSYGAYGGFWASNVDFDGAGTGDDPNLELDVYLGYGAPITDDMSLNINVYRYNYSGVTSYDYYEISAGMDYKGIVFNYWYTNDYGGSDTSYRYTELNYGYEFMPSWSVDLHYGYNIRSSANNPVQNYADYSLGVSTTVDGIGLSLAWLGSNLDDKVNEGANRSDNTWLGSITYSF